MDEIGDQIVLAYSIMGRVIVLYVVFRVSLDFPQCVDVSAFISLVVCVARLCVFCMWLAYVSFGSSVSPRIFGFLIVGSVSLLICRFRVLLYCAGSGVNRVVVVLVVLRESWFCWVQSCVCCRYCCTCVCAVFMFVWVESIVMSSAYVIVFTFGGGVGRSDMYMLKSVGDNTPPCGTPVFVLRSVDLVLLYSVNCLRPLM